MRLKSLRIRNYRTIGEDQIIDLPPSATIVGPNSTGKTNILNAIRMFYTGYGNQYGYSRASDLTFGSGSAQTTLIATFQFTGKEDNEVFAKYDYLFSLYDPPRSRDVNEIVLQLIFSRNDNPIYRLSSDSTTRVPRENSARHSQLLKEVVESVIDSTSIHFIPSSNSSEDIFREHISPMVKSAIARELSSEINAIQLALKNVSRKLTSIVRSAGLQGYEVDFGLPGHIPGAFLADMDFYLSDPARTSTFMKGRGIQALAMLSCFVWIAEKEKEAGLNSLWLIEEPESYLHPDLYGAALGLLSSLELNGQVVRTTHALTMVPRTEWSIAATALDKSGHTRVQRFSTSREATDVLRGSLGVKFGDFFGLSTVNIFTEGPSDIEMIRWAVKVLGSDNYPELDRADFRSFDGVKNLEGFLHANYAHIRPETVAISVFDGDEAGIRAVKALTGHLGKIGSGFDSNTDYVIVRNGFAIEGLFPDKFLRELHSEHPSWLRLFSVDASDEVTAIEFEDSKKKQAGAWLRDRAEQSSDLDEWATRWRTLLSALETAISTWRSGRR